jgi:hypothetical protein
LYALEGPADAARELARRIPGGFHGSVSLSLRNLSDLAMPDAAELRRSLETELRGRGATIVESGGADEIRVTLAQNVAGYLLVAEVRRGEERQVVLVPWIRTNGVVRGTVPAVTIEKELLTSQPEPILDAAKLDADLLILQPGRVARLVNRNGVREITEAAVFGAQVLPRDPRGRLVTQGGSYLAYLPGLICSGAVTPLDARCREAEEAWPLGREANLRASAVRGRNYFDGKVIAPGGAKTVPPFFSAAATEEPAGRLWIFTRLDGRAYLHDSALEPVGPLGTWGSEVAPVSVKCGGGSLVLASQPGGGHEKDTVRVYRIVERQVVEVGPAVELPGPVTALWPWDESSVLAVSRDIGSGEYAAYRLAIACSR